MKRRDLETYLRQHGCDIFREGGGHTIFIDAAGGRVAAVPRHKEIKTATVRAICKALDVPVPSTR